MKYKVALKTADSYGKDKRGYLASSRIRGHWLAKYWKELDDFFYPEYINQSSEQFFNPENQLKILKDYDAVILNKTYEWRLAKLLKENGIKVIVDMCDPDHLLSHSSRERVKDCIKTLSYADVVVVNGEELKKSVAKVYYDEDLGGSSNKQIYIIPDRIDLEFHKPRKKKHNKELKRVVWYGYSENLRVLEPYLAEIIDMDIEVLIITDKPDDGFVIASKNDPKKYVTFKHWHPETINELIISTDCVFIGKDPDPDLVKFKSNNRSLTGWALGMPVANDVKHLKKLRDRKLRQFQVRIQRYMLADYNIKRSVEEYKQIIKGVCQ